MSTRYFGFDGMRIAYSAKGNPDGTPIVLVHNAGASRHLWQRQLDHFADDHPVFALDLYGYGDSDVPASGYELDHYRDLLSAFLTDRGLETPILVGNCLGSAIIAHLLRTDDRPIGAVLINPLTEQTARAGGFGALLTPNRHTPVAVRNWLRRRGVPRFAARRTVSQWFSDPSLADRLALSGTLIDGLTKPGRLAALSAAVADLDTLARLDVEGLPDGAAPVCTVWGVENQILSSEAGRVLNRTLRPVREEWLDGCGHAAMIERAEDVNRIIAEFAASLSPVGRGAER